MLRLVSTFRTVPQKYATVGVGMEPHQKRKENKKQKTILLLIQCSWVTTKINRVVVLLAEILVSLFLESSTSKLPGVMYTGKQFELIPAMHKQDALPPAMGGRVVACKQYVKVVAIFYF